MKKRHPQHHPMPVGITTDVFGVHGNGPLTGSSIPRVLVTGGAGFLGSHLTSVLLEKGCVVYVVDNLITGNKANISAHIGHPRFHFYKADITQPAFARRFFEIPLDEIYHLACPTGVPNIQILAEEMARTCSVGTWHVMKIAHRHRSRVLFTSSSEIYGEPQVTPQHESYTGNVDPTGLRSPYEEGKRFSETLIMIYTRKHGLDARITRLFNAYGPTMSPHDQRVIPQFLTKVSHGENPVIYGDGNQRRTFVYADDLVRALMLVMEKGSAGEVYNIGGDKEVTMRELAEIIIKLTGHTGAITFVPHFVDDHTHRMPSLKKIKKLGWKQTGLLEDGLKRMIANFGLRRSAAVPVPALSTTEAA